MKTTKNESTARAHREEIFYEIIQERGKQDAEWGGEATDDSRTVNDWIVYIVGHAARAIKNMQSTRYQFIRVAALAVAAVEAYDRQTRKKQDDRNTP